MSSKTVSIDRAALIRALRDLEVIVVSLDRLGWAAGDLSREDYDRYANELLDDWDVTRKLANARAVLSAGFSESVGADGMDELERELQGLEYWSVKQRK